MSVEQYQPDDRDPGLRVYSELVAVRRFSEFSTPGYWKSKLQVLRFRDIIYQKVFESPGSVVPDLDNELSRLYLLFPEKPHGLHFRFRFEIMNDLGQLIHAFVLFDGLISTTFTPDPRKGGRKGRVNVRSKAESGELQRRINSVALRARDAVRKQTYSGSKSPKPSTQIKGLRPSPQNTDPTTFHYEGRSTVPNSNVDGLQTYFRHQREYSSQRTPGFKSVRKRDLKPLPYHMLLSKFYDDGGYTVRTDSSGESVGYSYLKQSIYFAGDFGDFTSKKGSHLSTGANSAIARLADKANNGSANLPEDLIQAAQTLRLFTSNVTRLRLLFTALKDGQTLVNAIKAAQLGSKMKATARAEALLAALRRQGVSGAQLIARMWLELRYGWLPLISDIQASIRVVSGLVTKSPVIMSLTASSTVNEEYLRNLFTDAVAGDTGTPTGQSMTRKRTTTRYRIQYKLTDPYLHAAAQLGLTSPVALGWELIPLSFVLDWALPIGQTLQLLHAFEGLTFLQGSKTQFTRTLTTVSYGYKRTVNSGGYISTYTRMGRGTAEAILHDRAVLTDFPKPSFPSVKNPFSTIHAANAVALLIVALTK